IFLNSDRSQRSKPGPRTTPRPDVPLANTPAGTGANAPGLNHCSSVRGASLGSPTRFGLTTQGLGPRQPWPVGSASKGDEIVNGNPLWKVVMPENSHPPARCPIKPCCDL